MDSQSYIVDNQEIDADWDWTSAKTASESQPVRDTESLVRAADAGGPFASSAITDQSFADWKAQLRSGLGPAELGEQIDTLLLGIAGDSNLTPSGLEMIGRQVNQRLKELGYLTKFTKAEWRSKVEQVQRHGHQSQQAAGPANGTPALRYQRLSDLTGALPGTVLGCGIRDTESSALILNVEPIIHQEIKVHDGDTVDHLFVGTVRLPGGKEVPWEIASGDYASRERLLSSLYQTVGSSLEINAKPEALRNAIAQISGVPTRKRRTTNLGWLDDGTGYLVPKGLITAAGFQPAGPDDDVQLDLRDGREAAAALGMKPLDPADLQRVRQHIVDDLLSVSGRRVTHALLGATAAAVLQPFSRATQRFALWLLGQSGCGKTTPATLFMNFFGNFPPERTGETNPIMNWGATANSIESVGYYFRNALYLVDDFKAGSLQQRQIGTVVQRYADGTSRNRLRADATLNVGRPIRGLLLVTAENRLDKHASGTARTIIVPVDEHKDHARLGRCLAERANYSGVMVDFLVWLLRNGQQQTFATRVDQKRKALLPQIQGQPNADRITSNFAILAAAHEVFAEYLGQFCPGSQVETRAFQALDVIELLQNMATEVKAQRPSNRSRLGLAPNRAFGYILGRHGCTTHSIS